MKNPTHTHTGGWINHTPHTHSRLLTFQLGWVDGRPESIEYSHTEIPVSEYCHQVIGTIGATQGEAHTQAKDVGPQ